MTLDRPLWLLLLAAPALLVWLHHRLRGPLVVRVSSVLPFRSADPQQAASAPERRFDPSLALFVLAATLLALAAAGPVLAPPVTPTVRLVVDRSASMGARLAHDTERTVSDDVLERALAAIRRDAPDAEVEVYALGTQGAALGSAAPDEVVELLATPPRGEDGLPGSLAAHLDGARDADFPGIVLATDRAVDSAPGLLVVGPSERPPVNRSVTDVVLDDDEIVVTVRTDDPSPSTVTVFAGSRFSVLRLDAGEQHSLRFPAPAPGATVSCRVVAGIAGQGDPVPDALPGDDLVRATRTGGARAARLTGREPHDRLRLALRAAGVEVVTEGDAAIEVRRGGPPAESDLPLLHVAAELGGTGELRVVGGPSAIGGKDVDGRGPLAAGLPGAHAALAATGRVAGGDVGLRDRAGALAVTAPGRVVTCLDPEDETSTWHEQPSFPVFVAAALEHLVGADRVEVEREIPAAESLLPRAAFPEPAPGAVTTLVRRRAPRDARRPLDRWLALAAALAIAGAIALSRR